MLAKVMDNAHAETPEVTREERERAVVKHRNGKAAGNDNIVEELLKSRGEAIVDRVTELVQEV